MSRKFKTADYDATLDVTVRLGDCLPPDHLARFARNWRRSGRQVRRRGAPKAGQSSKSSLWELADRRASTNRMRSARCSSRSRLRFRKPRDGALAAGGGERVELDEHTGKSSNRPRASSHAESIEHGRHCSRIPSPFLSETRRRLTTPTLAMCKER